MHGRVIADAKLTPEQHAHVEALAREFNKTIPPELIDAIRMGNRAKFDGRFHLHPSGVVPLSAYEEHRSKQHCITLVIADGSSLALAPDEARFDEAFVDQVAARASFVLVTSAKWLVPDDILRELCDCLGNVVVVVILARTGEEPYWVDRFARVSPSQTVMRTLIAGPDDAKVTA